MPHLHPNDTNDDKVERKEQGLDVAQNSLKV